jgi:hypothetical protein
MACVPSISSEECDYNQIDPDGTQQRRESRAADIGKDERMSSQRNGPALGATLTKLLITFTRVMVSDAALLGTCDTGIY